MNMKIQCIKEKMELQQMYKEIGRNTNEAPLALVKAANAAVDFFKGVSGSPV